MVKKKTVKTNIAWLLVSVFFEWTGGAEDQNDYIYIYKEELS